MSIVSSAEMPTTRQASARIEGNMMWYLRFRLLLIGMIFFVTSDVYAFSVSPLRLYVEAEKGVDTIKIKNPRNFGVTFSVRAFHWPDSENIGDLKPANDLLVVPPIFDIGPNEEQIIRVGKRTKAVADEELTYRLSIDEIPTEVGDRKGVDFNFSVTMPVYIAPKIAKADPQWRLDLDEKTGNKLVVENTGTAHLEFTDLRLIGEEGGDPVLLLPTGGPVFAGEQHSWPLEMETSGLNEPLSLTAKTNRGPINAVVTLPDS